MTSRTSSIQPTGPFKLDPRLHFQGWLSGLPDGGAVGIIGCTHDAMQPWLTRVAELIQQQTGVTPTQYLQTGGPFAYFQLSDRMRTEVHPWMLGTHDDIAEALHAALQLDGDNARIAHYLVVAEGPMCLCSFLQRRPEPAAEARALSLDLLPGVARRIASDADAHGRQAVVTAVQVRPGLDDPFAHATYYNSGLVSART